MIFNRLVPSYGMYGTDEVADFDDFTELAWAEDSLAVAYNKGYLEGYPDNTLQPRGTLTRAEAVTVILRILEKETIVNKDFTASINEDYEGTIYTGVVTVNSGASVTFENCVLLNTLKSTVSESSTNWKLTNDTVVSNYAYGTSSSGSSGGGGGGGGGGCQPEERPISYALHPSGKRYGRQLFCYRRF